MSVYQSLPHYITAAATITLCKPDGAEDLARLCEATGGSKLAHNLLRGSAACTQGVQSGALLAFGEALPGTI